MIKNNKRNSRDDKSKTSSSSTKSSNTGAGTNKPRARFSETDDKTPYVRDGKPNDKEERKTGFVPKYKENTGFKPRTPRDGETRPYTPRNNANKDFKPRDGAAKDYKPKTPRDNDTRPYTPRTTADKDFKPRTPRGEGAKSSFKPWEKKESGNADYKPKAYREGSSKDESEGKRSYIKKDNYATDGKSPFNKSNENKNSTARSTDSRPFRKREDGDFKPRNNDRGERVAPTTRSRKIAESKDDGLIRLNRYIANSGICSRRKADELIIAGVISVNGAPVAELGHKIDPYKDEIRYNGELLKREKKVYVLLNKPKDYITTTDDPQERRTVMQLVEKASRERIYPVGRLDRNTTGLILMTNDGDLADKLSHPKHGITKIYHVELSKGLSQGDFNKIQFGLELEDGLIKPDSISYVAGGTKKEVGIQIHSGKNRIVRRIFEHLGYEVVKLDRVVYGNLTKKDLPRGKWRFLEDHELIQIKHLIK